MSFEQLKTVSSAKKGEDIAVLKELSFQWETARICVINPQTGEDLFRCKKNLTTAIFRKLSFEWQTARISVISYKQAKTFFGAKKPDKRVI